MAVDDRRCHWRPSPVSAALGAKRLSDSGTRVSPSLDDNAQAQALLLLLLRLVCFQLVVRRVLRRRRLRRWCSRDRWRRRRWQKWRKPLLRLPIACSRSEYVLWLSGRQFEAAGERILPRRPSSSLPSWPRASFFLIFVFGRRKEGEKEIWRRRVPYSAWSSPSLFRAIVSLLFFLLGEESGKKLVH